MTLPTPPASVDYTGLMPLAAHNAFLNRTIGDCEVAGAYHILATLTGGNGAEYVASDARVQWEYNTLPYINRTVGVIKTWDVMDFYMRTGFENGSKLIGVIELDPANVEAIKTAIYLFQNLYVSMPMPRPWGGTMVYTDGWVANTTYYNYDPEWGDVGVIDVGDPVTWHVMGIHGYTASGVIASSFGHIGTITWAALARFVAMASINGGHVYEGPLVDADKGAQQGGGLWVWLTQDHIGNGNTTSYLGKTWPELMAQFAEFAQTFPLPAQYTGAAHAGQRTVRQAMRRGRYWRRGRRAESF